MSSLLQYYCTQILCDRGGYIEKIGKINTWWGSCRIFGTSCRVENPASRNILPCLVCGGQACIIGIGLGPLGNLLAQPKLQNTGFQTHPKAQKLAEMHWYKQRRFKRMLLTKHQCLVSLPTHTTLAANDARGCCKDRRDLCVAATALLRVLGVGSWHVRGVRRATVRGASRVHFGLGPLTSGLFVIIHDARAFK